MTENLLQKLEDKVISLLKELETLRHELSQVKNDNTSLKLEKTNSSKKLQGLISLVDALDVHPSMNVQEVLLENGEYVSTN